MSSNRRFLLLVLLTLVLTFSGCKGEPKQTAGRGEKVNPYAADSVFVEVKKKLAQDPKDAEAWFHLAELYERNSQYQEAVAAYEKVTSLTPDSGYAWLKMGTAYDRMNKPSEAIGAFRKAAKLIPDNALLYNNMGVAYGKLGKFQEEASALKKALKLRPSYSAASYNLGMTYLKLKNKKAAKAQYEELKKYDEGAAAALLKEIEAARQE